MNRCDQEGIGVEVVIDRDPVACIFKGMAVVAMLGAPVSGDLKLTFKIIYPARNNRCCTRREVIIQDYNLIQFISEAGTRSDLQDKPKRSCIQFELQAISSPSSHGKLQQLY